MSEIKEKLFSLCMEYIDERIRTAEQGIISAKEAAENDTKSSAGDKYETTREMMQHEISFNQVQLHEARKLKYALSLINPSKKCTVAETGSLVYTEIGNFFIAVSATPLSIDGESYHVISSASPVAKAMQNHKENDFVTFNGKRFSIKSII